MIDIVKSFQCRQVFDEFNQILREIIEIQDEGKPTEIFGKKYTTIEREEEYDNLIQILLNILEEKTNITNFLESKTYSHSESYIKQSFKGLKTYKDEDELYKKFIENLNNQFQNSSSEFTFIIPINIVFNFEYDGDDLKTVLEVFDITKFDSNNYQNLLKRNDNNETDDENSEEDLTEITMATMDETLELIEDFPEVLMVSIRARDLYYANDKATFKIESFFGYLSFITNYLSKHEYFGNITDYSLNKLSYGIILVIKDGEIIWPPEMFGESTRDKIREYEEKIDEKDFKLIIQGCELLKNITSQSLINILHKSYVLYYLACKEERLYHSFLNFWILNEQIIKYPSAKSDEDVLRIIKSFFVGFIMSKRIDYLYEKRNDLVHKGYFGTVTGSERNIAKLIADILLMDAMHVMENFRNKEQYDYYLINKGIRGKKRRDYIKVLELFNKEKI